MSTITSDFIGKVQSKVIEIVNLAEQNAMGSLNTSNLPSTVNPHTIIARITNSITSIEKPVDMNSLFLDKGESMSTEAIYKKFETHNTYKDELKTIILPLLKVLASLKPQGQSPPKYTFDIKTGEPSQNVIDFLAYTTIVKRATFLYICGLLIERNLTIIDLHSQLNIITSSMSSVSLPFGTPSLETPHASNDLASSLLEIEEKLKQMFPAQGKPSKVRDEVLSQIANIKQGVQSQSSTQNEVVKKLGEITARLANEYHGYRVLVHDIMPMMRVLHQST